MRVAKFAKANVISIDLWDLFRQKLQNRLMEKLITGALTLAMLDAEKLGVPMEIDFEQWARDYEPVLGERIVKVTQGLKRIVGAKVVSWYNTPGSTMQSIFDQLQEVFVGKLATYEGRAWNVAQNEIAELHGAVTENLVRTAGVEEWWWSTKQDHLVCKKPMVGPDGKVYKGCRELHGKVFKTGMLMPPKGSHISCRCDAIPMTRSIRAKVEKPIVDLSHLGKFDEAEHPRDKAGEFTSKGEGVHPAIREFESRIVNDSEETAGVFIDGLLVIRKTGDTSGVDFTEEEAAKLRGATLTHNHPRGMSFSLIDVQFMIVHGLSETRIISKQYEYSIKIKAGHKISAYEIRDAFYQAKYDLEIDGTMINNEENDPHYIWVHLAKTKPIEYTRKGNNR